jgi:hypothetical protein
MASPCQLSNNEQAKLFGNSYKWRSCRNITGSTISLHIAAYRYISLYVVALVFAGIKQSRQLFSLRIGKVEIDA